ncbi:MAG: GTPase HflX [Gammaproteobacteria bacterium]|nr:GTPase HflX [Gammaproteobacteria bacterium]
MRNTDGESVLLVHLNQQHASSNKISSDEVEEFALLAKSAGGEIVAEEKVNLRHPNARYYLGSGKVEQIKQLVKQHCAELVLVNAMLSPSQERNLEKQWSCRVLDRAGLILDIFAQRARSFEGKLQVELAQLKHLSTRLVRGWTHLERQKGGIGLRGPGETQLETDRRLLNLRIKSLNRKLNKVTAQRDLGRNTRQRADVPTVALVGYTNAGKSTLFNALTRSEVYVADQLFATLDPTLRQLQLLPNFSVVLADTVGFVRDLPHELVAAFRSTLQETRDADVLLHVLDNSDPQHIERAEQVNEVLEEVGAADVPQILVYNKIDRMGKSPGYQPAQSNGPSAHAASVWLSALRREGLDALHRALIDQFAEYHICGELRLSAKQGAVRSALYQIGAVHSDSVNENGDWLINIQMNRIGFKQFCKKHALTDKRLNFVEMPHTSSMKSKVFAS